MNRKHKPHCYFSVKLYHLEFIFSMDYPLKTPRLFLMANLRYLSKNPTHSYIISPSHHTPGRYKPQKATYNWIPIGEFIPWNQWVQLWLWYIVNSLMWGLNWLVVKENGLWNYGSTTMVQLCWMGCKTMVGKTMKQTWVQLWHGILNSRSWDMGPL